MLRYAVFLPDRNGPLKLITDIAVSPTDATDDAWGKLGLEELRDALGAALEASAGPESGQLLRSLYSGETPARATVELYLWSAAGESGGRESNTLNSTIDLDALGPPARTDHPALQGMFAVAGNTSTATAPDRRSLVIYALIRMALDWGYLDARANLIPLAAG